MLGQLAQHHSQQLKTDEKSAEQAPSSSEDGRSIRDFRLKLKLLARAAQHHVAKPAGSAGPALSREK